MKQHEKNESNIPANLKNRKSWICWRKEEEEKRIKKIPYSPNTGKACSVTDVSHLSNFYDAIQACDRYGLNGIGFVFRKEDGIVGIDIDHCVDDDGNLSDLAKNIISSMKSYTEYSPSGRGIHIYCEGTIPDEGRRNQELELEVYDDKRFFTVTGDVFEDYFELEVCDEKLQTFHSKYMIRATDYPRIIEPIHNSKVQLDVDGIVEKACRSRNGGKFKDLYNGSWEGYYKSQSDAEMGFANMLAFWTNKNYLLMNDIFVRSGMHRKKWNEVHYATGETYGKHILTKAVDSCISTYTPKEHKTEIKKSSNTEQMNGGNEVNERDELPAWYVESNGKTTFLAGILSRHLADTVNAFYLNERFHLYQDGVYTPVEETKVKKIIRGQLIDKYAKSCHVRDVYEQWCCLVMVTANDLDFNNNPLRIFLKNGFLDPVTHEYTPYRPEHMATTRINCNYVSGSTCVEFEKFIHQSLSDDLVLLTQEVLGYLMIPCTFAQKSFMLVGPTSTGKSTFLNVIEGILGENNYSTLPWHKIAERFQTALLFGKLANIYSDLPDKGIEDNAMFKLLTSGEYVEGEFKHATPFKFQNKARLVFSCNRLPANKGDRSDAFFRRIVILPFMKQVNELDQDPELSEKLINEKEGIFIWALEGLKRLIENRFQFSVPQSAQDALDEYKEEIDTTRLFVNNYCVVDQNKSILSTDLWSNYLAVCTANGMKSESQQTFNYLITANNNGVIKTKDSNTRRFCFKGIALNDNQ